MKKILIISSNRLGDSILSSGLHNFLRNKYENVELTLVCGEIPSCLFKYCSNIDYLIVLKKKNTLYIGLNSGKKYFAQNGIMLLI